MSKEVVTDRFAKLRALRDRLCTKEDNWSEAFQARDWVVSQLKDIKKLCSCDKTSKQVVGDKVSDVLHVLDPKETSDDK